MSFFAQYPVKGSGSSGGGGSPSGIDFGDGSDGAAVLNGTNTYSFLSLGGMFTFTVTAANATITATYTDSVGTVFNVMSTISGSTTLVTTSGLRPSPSSGTLTLASGTGDATITYASSVLTNPTYYTLRPIFLTDLTISAGTTLYCLPNSIFGTGTLANAGTISASGSDGAAGGLNSGVPTQGTGGAGGNPGGNFTINNALNPLLSSTDLGSGSVGSNGAGSVVAQPGQLGNPGSSIGPYGLTSNASGNGGNGTAGLGGLGVSPILSGSYSFRKLSVHLISGVIVVGGGCGGNSGGSGGSDAVHEGGGGGGGGGSGGVIGIWFNTINNTGTIVSNGGNGGAGETPPLFSTGVGGGGGGSGGSGGFVYIIAETWTAAGTIHVLGGTAGAAGTGKGTGTNGTAGGVGSAGLVMKFNTTTGVWF